MKESHHQHEGLKEQKRDRDKVEVQVSTPEPCHHQQKNLKKQEEDCDGGASACPCYVTILGGGEILWSRLY